MSETPSAARHARWRRSLGFTWGVSWRAALCALALFLPAGLLSVPLSVAFGGEEEGALIATLLLDLLLASFLGMRGALRRTTGAPLDLDRCATLWSWWLQRSVMVPAVLGGLVVAVAVASGVAPWTPLAVLSLWVVSTSLPALIVAPVLLPGVLVRLDAMLADPGMAARAGRLDQQRPLRGLLYTALGTLLLLVALLVPLGLLVGYGAPGWAVILAILLLGVPGVMLSHRGAQHRVRVGFGHDGRSPVLFLRSFQTEGSEAYPAGLNEPGRARYAFWRALVVGLRGHTRYEDLLAFALRRVGPLVAIGEPGEALPETGAQRVYFRRDDDEGWKREVDGLLGTAVLVLLEVGSSPGLGWEVERAIARLRATPERLVLCVPLPTRGFRHRDEREVDRQATWARFRALHGHHFPRGLPERPGTAQFVCFDPLWEGVTVRGEDAPILRPVDGSPSAALRWLAAVLERAS